MAAEDSTVSEMQFPCGECGALQTYAPGTNTLHCPYCRHTTVIEDGLQPIREYDFQEALRTLSRASAAVADPAATQVIHCDACGASFEFAEDIHSGECPFCATPVVLGNEHKQFKPQSLLPFRIEQSQAKEQFRRWLKSLWFAPGDLKKYARDDTRLQGVYLPYWTYDSDTVTDYVGERGDYYQEAQRYTVMVDGRQEVRTRMVTRVRWRSARGIVTRFFDDVLIGATRSLPRKISDRLGPWDLEHLVPFTKEYLSGYSSQVYQVDLDEGFEHARAVMDGIIRGDIARDIGGDAQRIHQANTRHRRTTFKHLLLPVWTAGFRFRDREYLFVVNARSGKVRGERPYSKVKILLAALAAALALAAAAWAYTTQLAHHDEGGALYLPGFGRQY